MPNHLKHNDLEAWSEGRVAKIEAVKSINLNIFIGNHLNGKNLPQQSEND